MVNLTLTEATLNAVRAALDERVARLDETVRAVQLSLDAGAYRQATEDAQRALVWNIAALHETKTAVEDFAEVRIADHPASATWSAFSDGMVVSESELRAMAGNR